MKPSRPVLMVLAAVVVAVVVLALVAGRSRRQTFDEGTPQATLQNYLDAVFDGDPDQARTFLDQATDERCERPLRRNVVADTVRAVLIDERIDQDRATIEVRLTFGDDSPFGSGGYDMDERFFLERLDDEWRIAEDPWPAAPCDR